MSKDIEGVIFNIQKFSLHDGPGIRTIVFFKGCNMSCLWCSNPESQEVAPQIMFNKNLCAKCGRCQSVCETSAIDMNSVYRIDKSKCIKCKRCVESCLNGALVLEGKKYSVEEIIKELKKDSVQYRRSNGGITLSGGEVLLQPDFAVELLKECKAYGWHTAIETAMYVNSEAVKKVMPYIDLAMIDIKSMNDEVHKRFTGVSNNIILKNIKLSDQLTKEIIIRIPVIEGFNADLQSIGEIAQFSKSLTNFKRIDLLPYHNYGENKYEAIGRDYLLGELKSPSEDKMERLKALVEIMGIPCTIGAQ
ncbi:MULTISPECIES: glycerol dehydratase activator DhaB2 [Clostridium]|uniref:Glycyl-radical enzyme activating protein n=1 Tax=Clostridium beijerinckii TaxID=1520 RepID=A0A1S9N0N3_CLOBE|nr:MULTISPECIES: glycyl-radical enzyme activating protein [Clostridium]MBN7575199.1 glycyl-radical enzyme activating protein [Clostridium beijerinckii]MBN7580502.1 glycyl-radical enzyme activating protein [Clostridium beijerinckii]MBN7584963.1 glycyl-radical enzyme activating protein [Clostridium beijerinckii]MBO0520543.1 glycyl-radical enzyme activating protein [Clostridium beijerinckii]MZK50543.1 glycyl-radical enzyme activating protein [Clostridium beijerinckii]